MDACRPTAVTAMCGVRVYPETPLAATLIARGEVPSAEALHEPFFYFAPAVRDGLAEVVADVGAGARQLAPPGTEGQRRGGTGGDAPRPRRQGRPLALHQPPPPGPRRHASMRNALAAVGLLTLSNLFMTMAWYVLSFGLILAAVVVAFR